MAHVQRAALVLPRRYVERFDSATNWTLQTSWSIGSGLLTCAGTFGGTTLAIYTGITPAASDLIRVFFTVARIDSGRVDLMQGGSFLLSAITTAGLKDTGWKAANGQTLRFRSINGVNDFDGDIDDFIVWIK